MLRAEWQFLNRPDRIQAAGRQAPARPRALPDHADRALGGDPAAARRHAIPSAQQARGARSRRTDRRRRPAKPATRARRIDHRHHRRPQAVRLTHDAVTTRAATRDRRGSPAGRTRRDPGGFDGAEASPRRRACRRRAWGRRGPVPHAARQERPPRLPRRGGLHLRLRGHRRPARRSRPASRSADAPTRAAASETSGARPDIVDRNGDMLATDVKMVSVFAEPRRIIDKDEAVELLTAVLPDLDARELREKLGTKKGFVWVKREITPRQQQRGPSPRPAGRRLPAREQARLSQRRRSRARARLRQRRQSGHRRHREVHRRAGPRRPQRGRLRRPTPADLKPVQLSIDLRVQHALRDELVKGMDEIQGEGGGRRRSSTSTPAR